MSRRAVDLKKRIDNVLYPVQEALQWYVRFTTVYRNNSFNSRTFFDLSMEALIFQYIHQNIIDIVS